MASALYPSFKQSLLTAGIDVENDDLRVVLLDASYTYSAAHDFLDDITGSYRVATSDALASKTITAGVFDAADKTITSVTGNEVVALVVYQHTGTESTSQLVVYVDGFSSVTPNGGNITVQWDSGAAKIFAL
jgi:hypothetical protein